MDTGYLYDLNLSDIENNTLFKVINGVKSDIVNVGINPYGVCVDLYNNTWNTNFSSDFVSRIKDGKKIDVQLKPGSKPYGICVNKNNYILVSNSGRNSISILSNDTKIDMDIEVGNTPKGIAVDCNNIAWVANFMSGTVARVDGRDVTYIKVGPNPYGVCVDKDNIVYVTNFGDGTVSRIKDGIRLENDIYVGRNPRGICIDIDNNVWVANSGDGTISKIVDGVNSKTITVGITPCGIAMDLNNNIIVVDSTSGNVIKLTNDIIVSTLNVGGTPITFGDFTGMQAYILFDDLEFSQIKKISYGDLNKPLQTMIKNGGGGVGGPVDASVVSYHNATYPSIEAALDKLLYVTPAINSFTNNVNTVEIGTVVNNLILNWSLNKVVNSQNIDQGVGSIPVGINTKILSGLNITTDKTWSISINDGTTNVNKTTSINFSNKRYWGVSALPSLTDANILGLDKEFSNNRIQSRTLNASGGRYLYFAMPTSFNCDISKFKIGGLFNSSWELVRRDFTNVSGHSVSYDIFRFTNLQTGSSISIDII